MIKAAGQGDLQTLRARLDSGEDVEDLSTGSTPLQWAALRNQRAAVEILLDAGAVIDTASRDGSANALLLAALHANTEIVRLLLARGADPNFASKASGEQGAGGMTALHNAAVVGAVEIIEPLIAAGAKVNAVCGGGWTALVWAIVRYREPDTILPSTGNVCNHYAVIERLINNNADVNLTDEDGNNALSYAEGSGLQGVVDLLKTARTR